MTEATITTAVTYREDHGRFHRYFIDDQQVKGVLLTCW